MLRSLRSVLADRICSLSVACELRGCRTWNASRSAGLRVLLLSNTLRVVGRALYDLSWFVREEPFDDVPF